MANKPDIFGYTSYRKFLEAFYNYSKISNPKFSHRYFAKKAGFSSPCFLYKVIKGERNLSKDYIQKFAKAMGLNKKESQFFEMLVSFDQAKTSEVKNYYLEMIKSFRGGEKSKLLSDGQYEYISNWYYPVIREMIGLPFFKEDPAWIRKSMQGHITEGQAKEALESLLRLGLVKRDEKGKLVSVDEYIATDDEVVHTAAYAFHQQMLSVAKHILASTLGHEREISCLTMAISKNQFKEIKKMIQEFENSVSNYILKTKDVPESVYQMNLQMFSLTGTPRRKDETA